MCNEFLIIAIFFSLEIFVNYYYLCKSNILQRVTYIRILEPFHLPTAKYPDIMVNIRVRNIETSIIVSKN